MDCIFTKRLVLRKITEKDLKKISHWSFSPGANGKYLSLGNYSHKACLEMFENHQYWNDHSKRLMIELKEGNRPLGTIRYWQKPTDYSAAMIALKIAEPSFRGQGLGTEAQRGLIHHLFTTHAYSAIEMITDIDNASQQRCLAKLGFTLTDIQSYEDHKTERLGRL